MPYAIRKNADGSYRVVNALTGAVHMKSGTKKDAEAQVRIMRASDSGRRLFRRRG